MKIGVLGAGSIGCYVGGRLAADGHDVVFVGRTRVRDELRASGLTLEDGTPRGAATARIAPERIRFELDPGVLTERDVVLVCVKSAQTGEIALPEDPSVLYVSMQNGVRNADVLRERLPGRPVQGGIVGFNVVSKGGGVFRRATTGPLVIEASEDARVGSLAGALERAGFETEVARDIRAMQWSKLLMNLNNAVSALTDAPTPALVFDPAYRRILAALIGEALSVLGRAGIAPKRLGPLPPRIYPLVLKLPTPLLRLALRTQLRLDPEARSSMWEDLVRGRATEVDYLNGEIVRLAASAGADAPLNARIVELVHDAERAGRGSPKTSAEALWSALHRRS